MISTFHHSQRPSRSSKVKAVLGESPSDTEVEVDSFDAQRDMLMNIIHQHFDRSEQGDDHTRNHALLTSVSCHGYGNRQGNGNGNGRRSASVKREVCGLFSFVGLRDCLVGVEGGCEGELES